MLLNCTNATLFHPRNPLYFLFVEFEKYLSPREKVFFKRNISRSKPDTHITLARWQGVPRQVDIFPGKSDRVFSSSHWANFQNFQGSHYTRWINLILLFPKSYSLQFVLDLCNLNINSENK